MKDRPHDLKDVVLCIFKAGIHACVIVNMCILGHVEEDLSVRETSLKVLKGLDHQTDWGLVGIYG